MELYSIAYFCLMMTFASLWIHKSAGLWGSFLTLSLILALKSGIVHPFSILVVVLLFFLFWILKTSIAGGKRHFLTLTALALAASLSYHWIPGFNNLQITRSFYFNFDQPFIGLFPLIFLVRLCHTRDDWIRVGLKAVPLIFIFIFSLLWLALGTGSIEWQLKFPSHFLMRIISNMFLIVIPQEAFFRGFLQKEISYQMGSRALAKTAGVIGSSLIFTLFHLTGNSSPLLLALIFSAAVVYGLIYELSGFLEGSILCHFTVNLLHMLFFSYPVE